MIASPEPIAAPAATDAAPPERSADAVEDVLDAGPPQNRAKGKRAHSRRRCLVTRQSLEPSEMIRFVRGPNGAVVADLGAKLPGRGAWVSATRDHVEAAVAKRLFSRAFRAETSVPDGFADGIETLLRARAAEGLALANKGGGVVTGAGKVEDAAKKGYIKVLLHAAEASPNEASKLDALARAVARARGRRVRILSSLTSDEMGLALGRPHVIHAAITVAGGAGPVWLALPRLLALERYHGAALADDTDEPGLMDEPSLDASDTDAPDGAPPDMAGDAPAPETDF